MIDPGQMTAFLATMFHAPCAQFVTFSEFWKRFQDWLPEGDRYRWTKAETGLQFRQHRELFHGAGNHLKLVDGSFRPADINQHVDELRMSQHCDRARYIDNGVDWAFRNDDGTWARVTVPDLIDNLRALGCAFEEIFRMRNAWRANPVSLSALLTGCK